MIIRRSGFSEAGGLTHGSLLGNSDILAFRYDAEQSRFSMVSGQERSFLGYARSEWLAAHFLGNALNGIDRLSILSLLTECESGQQIVRDCTLMDAAGKVSSAVIAAMASESDPTKISGQIIILDPQVVLTSRHGGNQSVNIDLMRLLVRILGQSTRSLSGYSDLLVRHLAIQGDDLGSEHALGLGDAIAGLEKILAQLRPLSAGSPTAHDVAEINTALQATQEADLNSPDGAE